MDDARPTPGEKGGRTRGAAEGRSPGEGPARAGPAPAGEALPSGETLPPGQRRTRKWPVLHVGGVPEVDRESWRLEVRGAVSRTLTLDWDGLMALPQRDVRCDLHCVTGWSRPDARFTGVPLTAVARLVGPRPGAAHARALAPDGWSSSLPLDDLLRDDVLLAHRHEDEPLSPEHGGPVRLVVPHLYFWKSAKWVTGLEISEEARPGFWERSGYHPRGDPWAEERFAW